MENCGLWQVTPQYTAIIKWSHTEFLPHFTCLVLLVKIIGYCAKLGSFLSLDLGLVRHSSWLQTWLALERYQKLKSPQLPILEVCNLRCHKMCDHSRRAFEWLGFSPFVQSLSLASWTYILNFASCLSVKLANAWDQFFSNGGPLIASGFPKYGQVWMMLVSPVQ